MSGKKGFALAVIGALGLMGIMPVSAANDQVYQMNEVIVTAQKYNTPDLDIPASTEVISSEKIEKMGAKSVMEVMQNIPGFVISESPSGNGSPGLRGIPGHLSILINGIPLNSESYYQMGTLSAANIDRIEVVKGGSAVLYGSKATSGVINIITKKGGQNSITLGAGNKGQYDVQGYVSAKGLSVSYEHYELDHAGPVYKSGPTTYTRDDMYRDSVNVTYTPDDHWTLMYLYSDRNSDVGIFRNSLKTGHWKNNTYNNVFETSYVNDNFRATAYYQNRAWDYTMYTARGASHGKTSGRATGIDMSNKWNLSWTDLTVGGTVEREDTKSASAITNSRNHGGLYFLTNTPLSPKVNFLFGSREVFTGDSGNEFCPQFQLLYKINSNSSAYVNINKSLLEPTLAQRFSSSATQVSNPDLKPERGWTYEAGWKKMIGQYGALKFDVYHMDINDRLYSDKITSGINKGKSMYMNANKYKNTGVELSYDWQPPEGFSYGLGISSSNPQQIVTSGGSWVRSENRLSIHSELGYTRKNTSIDFFFNYAGQRVNKTDPMFSLDMNIIQKLTENDSISFKMANVLNRDDYRSNTGGSILPERNWLLSYQHKF